MKKAFGLIGLFALATSITSGRNPKTTDAVFNGLAEGRTASVCIMPDSSYPSLNKATLSQGPVSASVDSVPERPLHGKRAAYSLLHSRPSPIGRLAAAGERRSANTELFNPQPLWLAELNRWRRMAGLTPVAENGPLNHGSEQHARYLVTEAPHDVAGFRAYDRNIGPRAHTEIPHSRAYTVAGAEAAIGGPLAPDIIQGADVAWEGRSESDDIDELILAPFHRLSLLAPWARVGGYGSFGVPPRRAAALALRGPADAGLHPRAIEFPPANVTVPINVMSGAEWPNPTAGCAAYSRPVGLPITLQTGHHLVLQSFSLRDETSAEVVAACGFDAVTYRNSDSTQQRRGRELLGAYGGVILIPRSRLSFGHEYHVRINSLQGIFEWSFSISHAVIETAGGDPEVPQVAASR
jgi:hypothetical protein